MALLYLRDARSTQTDLVEFSIAPVGLSRYTGTAPEFAISPDGRHVAFAATTQGVSTLWVRSLATLAQRSIPGTEGAQNPFWSPDSGSLGFFASGQLKTVRVSGGSPVVVCEAPFVDAAAPSGTWNRSDVIVFGLNRAPLQRVGSQGGTPTPVTTLAKDDAGHRWPSFLPDGQHFLYLAQGLHVGRTAHRIARVSRHRFARTVRVARRICSGPSVLCARGNPRGAALRRRTPASQQVPRCFSMHRPLSTLPCSAGCSPSPRQAGSRIAERREHRRN